MRCKLKKSLLVGLVLIVLLYTLYLVHSEKKNYALVNTEKNKDIDVDELYQKKESPVSVQHQELVNIEKNKDIDVNELYQKKESPVSVKHQELDEVTDIRSTPENKSEEVRENKSINFSKTTGECSTVKAVEHNGAQIQVSSLVDRLDFHSDHGGKDKSSFPDLQPLPTSEHLKIILVPHSHCDPGWLETYTEYFKGTVRDILTNMYNFAISHSDFKYIFAEVSFFSLWWEEQDETVRNGMRQLANQGRFEFVQGGWVQADESSTHYFALINQMLDGHDWLKRNFPEAVPKSGWAIDPFGLSPMMGYINKLFGINAMHIQRVHYSVKNYLAESRNLDFRWRQAWDDTGTTDILTHLAPFFGYNSKYTCGPDPDVCDQYDFRILKNPRWFRPHRLLARTTPSNVQERSLKILDQWRKKAALHSTNTVLVEIGDDFTYHQADVLPEVHKNYKGIIEYINSDPSLNTSVDWGTLSDYFDTVRQQFGTDNLPVLSGDFFTYADRQEDYWSGYYTARPFYKNLDRVLESALRRTEILLSFDRSRTAATEEAMVAARQALSLFQHHDGITGTAKPKVVKDYGARLYNAYSTCNKVTLSAIKSLLQESGVSYSMVAGRSGSDQLLKYSVIPSESQLVMANTLPRYTRTVQLLAVDRSASLQVIDVDGHPMVQQVEPRVEMGDRHTNSKYIVFPTNMPAISIQTHKLIQTSTESKASVEVYNGPPEAGLSSMFDTITHSEFICQNIVIGSSALNLEIECTSGRLVRISRGTTNVTIQQEVLLYTGKSGAYIFRPTGSPKQLHESSSRPKIMVIRGPVRHKAVVYLSSTLILTYSVNLVGGETEQYIDLEMLSELKNSGDLVIRFQTDIQSGDSLFTDLNGHTIQHHKFKAKLKTQGNFFPMPSTAFIQDPNTRFTLLSTEPHAVASLSSGSLEVVLDRYTTFNDDRGLGEGLTDNLPTPSRLRILLESRVQSVPKGEGAPEGGASPSGYVVEYPSLGSHLAQQSLLNPIFVGYTAITAAITAQKNKGKSVQLMNSIPCNEELVNLRHIKSDTSLLIRRKLGITCHIDTSSSDDQACVGEAPLSEWFVGHVKIRDHPMSPFMEHSDFNNYKPMEFSSHYVTFSSGESKVK